MIVYISNILTGKKVLGIALIISKIFVIFEINFVKLTFNFISFEETGIVTIDFGEIAEEMSTFWHS